LVKFYGVIYRGHSRKADSLPIGTKNTEVS
jgi:hypothetical protein